MLAVGQNPGYGRLPLQNGDHEFQGHERQGQRVLDGWRPAYPSYREGLRAAMAEIEAE